MSMQIEKTQNTEDVWLFMSYLPKHAAPKSYDDVPLQALLPAFMLSELKTAFLIGFQIYLPFLILDMVVASVMVSMGMLMVPPAMVRCRSSSCCSCWSTAGTWSLECCCRVFRHLHEEKGLGIGD